MSSFRYNSVLAEMPTNELSLKNLPAFLEQFPMQGHLIAFDFQDDYMGWKALYGDISHQEQLADFGAALSAMLGCFLKFDSRNGNISSGNADTVFQYWQEMIVRALSRCEDRPILVDTPAFTPASPEQSMVYNFLAAYVNETISCDDWPSVRNVLQHLIYKLLPCPHDEHQQLSYKALNDRLEESGIPYGVIRGDNGSYSICAKEESTEKGQRCFCGNVG